CKAGRPSGPLCRGSVCESSRLIEKCSRIRLQAKTRPSRRGSSAVHRSKRQIALRRRTARMRRIDGLGVPAEVRENPLDRCGLLGALAPENLAKPRPAPPFDLTGTWQHASTGPDSWRFVPEEFELTPEAQRHYDAGQEALAEGKIYRDDIGQCWPAGMPLIMTRVWPIDMIQLPTAIYMVSHFMNSLRVIFLDGRPHSEPDIVVPSW